MGSVRNGLSARPSTVTSDRYPATAAEVLQIVSNSDGFRTRREYGEPDPRRRILVVGDSFVFGLGVRAEDRLTEVLESRMPGWRVDNLGMTGWGIDLMLRGLEHVGLKARPDIVVLAVYTDDFRRLLPYFSGAGFSIPKYELTWQRWKDRNRFDLNEAILNRIRELTQHNEINLVVLFLPGKSDTDEDQRRRRFLADWSRNAGVPFLDLTGPIHGPGVGTTFIEGNWHWNPVGHRIAAEEISRFLLGNPELVE